MRINKHTYFKIAFLGLFFLSFFGTLSAQEKETKATKEAKLFMAEAEEALANDNFALAEAKYREAIAKDPNLADANYNLGNLYYKNNIAEESSERLQKSASVAQEKALKHKAYHNQGNAFMAQEKYQKAVEAYKNALRNRPSDDQTRYNLALAKEKLEKEKQNQKNKDDKNKQDKKDQQDKQDKDKQNKDGKQDKKDKSGDGENKDKNEKPSDKENKKDKKDKDKQGDKEDKKDQQPEQQKGGDNKADQQPQPRKGELSKQQIKNLLEAMENQEKKIQDKINAKKAKGQKSNVEKDW